MLFAGLRAGVVTAVTGTAALAAALTSTFHRNIDGSASADDACKAIAADIHTFTKTVTVTSPAPPPPLIATVL